MHSALRSVVLATIALALLCVPFGTAWAGKRSMIPPGHEQVIREFVERALALEPTSIHIERDRIRVDPDEALGPRFVVFHPAIDPSDEFGDLLAPGVVVVCGTDKLPRACDEAELAEARPSAEALARERDPLAETIWTVEESEVRTPAADHGPEQRGLEAVIDQAAAVLALGLALAVLGLAIEKRRGAGGSERASRAELGFVALGLLGFVTLTAGFTSLWPLHEHASFVARADCTLDPYCLGDPIGAWSPTSFHVLALVFGAIPYTLRALSVVSLVFALLSMTLVWALTRTLLIELGRPQLAKYAAAASLVVLVIHPVHWRLAGSASFWPYALVCVLGAALTGLWASRQARAWMAALGWTLAGLLFAFVCGGNIVLITLLPLVWIAPMCWTRTRSFAAGVWRLAVAGPAAVIGVVLVLVGDLDYVVEHISTAGDMQTSSYEPGSMLANFDLLLLDPRISALVWVPAVLLAPAWLFTRSRDRARDLDDAREAKSPPPSSTAPLHPVRLLAPVVYAGVVPHLVLGVAAGQVIGSGYPVGFLNHHWELLFCAVAVGLGTAWWIAALTPAFERWLSERGKRSARVARMAWPAHASRLGVALIGITAALGLATAPLAREGWRMATQTGVVERELAALQGSFAQLPEHSRLVLAPRILGTLGNGPRAFDPIEVNFPIGAYQRALRERGLEPAQVLDIDAFLAGPPPPDARTLIYVGSALRSFQPPEIEAGLVPDALERPELIRLRDRYALVPVLEFELAAEQHEAISLRLGADRSPTTTLGFYWLVAHH